MSPTQTALCYQFYMKLNNNDDGNDTDNWHSTVFHGTPWPYEIGTVTFHFIAEETEGR